MSEKSNIPYVDSAHAFWRGCSWESIGCDNCWAKSLVGNRLKGEWGPGGVRVRSKDFGAPLRWNRRPWVCDGCGIAFAKPTGHGDRASDDCVTFHRRRVFALSLGDWLEGEPLKMECRCGYGTHDKELVPIGGIPVSWIADMLDVVRRCDQLEWILCTKRPENFFPRLKEVVRMGQHHNLSHFVSNWLDGHPPKNITMLTSVENQKQADKRIPELLKIPAARRGLSLEPLLGPVNLFEAKGYWGGIGIDWLIVGGESGPRARPMDISWLESIAAQAMAVEIPLFVKQDSGSKRGQQGRIPDTLWGRKEFPNGL